MNQCIITGDLVKTKIRKRRKEIHKGDCGRVLIVAGSEGMMGAAVLACRAALRSGAGLVQLAIPKDLFPVAQIAVPEATCRQWSFSPEDLAKYDAVAAGPGLGTSKESVEVIRNILEFYSGPLVLDADGLNVVAEEENGLLPLLRNRSGQTVITPHIGEAKRLLPNFHWPKDFRWSSKVSGDSGSQAAMQADVRRQMADMLKEKTGAAVVLKGSESLVAAGDFATYINTTGNPGMATGGSGDVLTGLIAGLWGQKQPTDDGGWERLSGLDAAVCGVYLHGLAGDLAARELGEYGLIASDIVEKIPFAVKKILEG